MTGPLVVSSMAMEYTVSLLMLTKVSAGPASWSPWANWLNGVAGRAPKPVVTERSTWLRLNVRAKP